MDEIKKSFWELVESLENDFSMNEEEAKDTAVYLLDIYGLL